MSLIHLPQTKWEASTGRQVILKGDFAKLEAALLESFELGHSPSLEYVGASQVKVNATSDCKARVMLCGFPSPLQQGSWVHGGLTDGRYRENAAPETLDLAVADNLWGMEKSSQWYCVYALAGATDLLFSLKGMPVMRASSQAAQSITLRNNANSANIGYGLVADELAGAKMLMLTGASRGLGRSITANNSDNGTGGTITYDGATLTLTQGDWFVVLPNTNFRYLGMILNDAAGNLVPLRQHGTSFAYHAPRTLSSGALNGFTAIDLALAAPPTARMVEGFAAAQNGAEVKWAISYDGSTAALVLHGAPPAALFQGARGAIAFSCQVPESHKLYLDNGNSADQTVKVTGWRE
jgi:hypothetical protein